MTTAKASALSLGILGVLGLVAWLALGPNRVTGQTFAWVTALAIALIAIVLLTVRAGQPTRTIAHVLYDAEHPDQPDR